MRVKPLEKSLNQPWQSHRYYLSRRKETRLAKNRVSVSIPYAFCEKPGFLGVRVEGMSVLAPPRNPVGKKPGFSINTLRFLRKTRFLRCPRRGDVGFGSPQKPGWQKTGFLNLTLRSRMLIYPNLQSPAVIARRRGCEFNLWRNR